MQGENFNLEDLTRIMDEQTKDHEIKQLRKKAKRRKKKNKKYKKKLKQMKKEAEMNAVATPITSYENVSTCVPYMREMDNRLVKEKPNVNVIIISDEQAKKLMHEMLLSGVVIEGGNK